MPTIQRGTTGCGVETPRGCGFHKRWLFPKAKSNMFFAGIGQNMAHSAIPHPFGSFSSLGLNPWVCVELSHVHVGDRSDGTPNRSGFSFLLFCCCCLAQIAKGAP